MGSEMCIRDSIISEELVRNDTYTSIHIEEFDVEVRETKLGREEFTRDIPNVSERRFGTSTKTESSKSVPMSALVTSWSVRFHRNPRQN